MTEMDLKKLKAREFIVANGHVLRTINILRTKYTKLQTIENIVEGYGVSKGQCTDSVNFLQLEGYIHLRNIVSREEISLADTSDYYAIEAKLTGLGIRVLSGVVKDELIEV